MSQNNTAATVNFDALFDAAALASEGSSRPHLDLEGTWVVKATEASYGNNFKGTGKRGMVKAEVVASRNGTANRTGALTNLYLNVSEKQELTQRNLAPYAQALLALGVPKEKLLDDVHDMDDLVQSIVAQINKLLKRGVEVLLTLQTRKDGKVDDHGRATFYKNIFPYRPEEVPTAPSFTSSTAVDNAAEAPYVAPTSFQPLADEPF